MKKQLLKEELNRMRQLAGISKENNIISEGYEVMVADMKEEAQGLMIEIKDSLDFASAKLYELKKMSDNIRMDYPELSQHIDNTVEPMMDELENKYPNNLKGLLKKFF